MADDYCQTPSPHRFLSGQSRKASPTKKTKPPSALRQTAIQEPNEPAATPQPATPSQFVATPRFSLGKPKPPTVGSRPQSLPKPSFIDALRATAAIREDVDDALLEAHDEDEEMLDGEHAHALPTTESDRAAGYDWTNDLPYSPKKRRLDELGSDEHEMGTSSSPARQGFAHPQMPASQMPKTTPRFAAPHTSHNASIDEVASQHRPPFLRASVAQQEPTEPLPEAFSPHRRGQKFVPGGMAATVQQWVMEAGQAAVQSRRGQAYSRGEDFVVRVKIEEIKGDGPFVVKAQKADGARVDVLLTQRVGTASSTAGDVKVGSVVGIRAPTWQVEIEGRSWTVGVDWKIL